MDFLRNRQEVELQAGGFGIFPLVDVGSTKAGPSESNCPPKGDNEAKLDKEKRKQLRWRSKKNVYDKGVIMMRNMEMYYGEEDTKWESGLYKERTKKKRHLKDLCLKYLMKILSSEINRQKHAIHIEVTRLISMETSMKARRGRI
ncbi:hypothetical protein L6452_02632 [Arctium lappa]|uniref:Uncharacterized protein n=1 Tax=Arctium lappa TaxID=4217 RepID=A0ACB9FJX5_ARCLA|nr:hypothetical protein L6452_02632 [Arctium lappa]